MMPMVRARVFGQDGDPRSGNAAAVAWWRERRSAAALAAAARAVDTPVVAFLFGGDPCAVRFFTPEAELPFCGHGALAAGAAEARRRRSASVRLSGRKGSWAVLSDHGRQGHAALVLDGPGWTREEPRPEPLLAALGLSRPDLAPAARVHVASVGSAKWLIEVRGAEVLARLRPRMDALKHLSGVAAVNGAYVYARQGDAGGVRLLARGFNPLGGVAEDAATGVAAAALGWLLRGELGRSTLVVEQGIELRHLNRIDVRLAGDRVRIGGRVIFEDQEGA